MADLRSHPCPFCGATSQREHLREGEQFCGRCGYLFTLDTEGQVIAWATTNRSHPRGVWWTRSFGLRS